VFSPDVAAIILNGLNLAMGGCLVAAVARRRKAGNESRESGTFLVAAMAGAGLAAVFAGLAGFAPNEREADPNRLEEKIDRIKKEVDNLKGEFVDFRGERDKKIAALTAKFDTLQMRITNIITVNNLIEAAAPPDPVKFAAFGRVTRVEGEDRVQIDFANTGGKPAMMVSGDLDFCRGPGLPKRTTDCTPASPNPPCGPRNFLCPLPIIGIGQRLQRYATILPEYRKQAFGIRITLSCGSERCAELLGARDGPTLKFEASAPSQSAKSDTAFDRAGSPR
jgi:hypothetical protein